MLLAMATIAAPSPRAEAFPNDVLEACLYNIDTPEFAFMGTWPSTMKTAARNGILGWNGSLDYDGVALVTWSETTSPSNLDARVYWEDLAPGIRGTADCVGTIIRIDSSETNSTIVQNVTRHEAGHIVALHHTGYSDSHNGDSPTMATCLDDTQAAARIKAQDDVGSLNFSHSIIGNPYHESPFMANFGYEQGFSYWGQNGGTVVYQTSGGATGPGHIAFTPGDPATNYVYQTMTYADAPSKSILAVANHKLSATLDSATVTVELWARDINYGTTPDCSLGNWPNGKNMNQRSVVGSWVRRATLSVSSLATWTRTGTGSWSTLADGDMDVQVRVFADPRTNTGARTSIRLDNVRVTCLANQPEGDCL